MVIVDIRLSDLLISGKIEADDLSPELFMAQSEYSIPLISSRL